MTLADVLSKEDRVEVMFSTFHELVDRCARLDAVERIVKMDNSSYVNKDILLAVIGGQNQEEEDS